MFHLIVVLMVVCFVARLCFGFVELCLVLWLAAVERKSKQARRLKLERNPVFLQAKLDWMVRESLENQQ